MLTAYLLWFSPERPEEQKEKKSKEGNNWAEQKNITGGSLGKLSQGGMEKKEKTQNTEAKVRMTYREYYREHSRCTSRCAGNYRKKTVSAEQKGIFESMR